MNTDTVIIVAIASVVGALFVLLLLVRILKSLAATSNPLPPPQPLAHHREQDLAKFHTYGYSAELTLLIPPADDPSSLPVPHPHYIPRPGSSSSFASSASSAPTPPLPVSPLPGLAGPVPFPRPRLSSSRQHRPLSVASTNSVSSRTRVDSGRRGLPHGPHSQMHIILPAPLSTDAEQDALQTLSRPHSFYSVSHQSRSLSPRPMSRLSITHDAPTGSTYSSLSRRSMVDRWVSLDPQTETDAVPSVPPLPPSPIDLADPLGPLPPAIQIVPPPLVLLTPTISIDSSRDSLTPSPTSSGTTTPSSVISAKQDLEDIPQPQAI